MAEYSGFFDGSQQYGQEELARYFDNIYESGVAMINDVKAGFNMTVVTGGIKVEPGFAIIKGYYYYLDTAVTISLPPGTDTIRGGLFIGLDLATKKISLYKREAVSTTYPSPVRNDTVYELQLDIYYISTNGTIGATDHRLTNNYCGVIRPKNLSEFNIYIEQCEVKWNAWFNQQKGTGWRSIYYQTATPTDATEGSLWMQL